MIRDTGKPMTFGAERAGSTQDSARNIRTAGRRKRSWTRLLSLGLLLLAACNLPTRANPNPGPVLRMLPTPTQPAAQAAAPATVAASDYVNNLRVLTYDPFDNMDHWKFRPETGTLLDGAFQLRGTAGWHSSAWYKKPFTEGQGVIIAFKVHKADARSEIVIVTGDWKTPTFRQFGLYNGVIPRTDLFEGLVNLGGKDLSTTLVEQPDMWYEMLLAIGHGGHLLAAVWDPNDPARRSVFNIDAGAAWSNLSWIFLPKANAGETLTVANFYRIEFTSIK